MSSNQDNDNNDNDDGKEEEKVLEPISYEEFVEICKEAGIVAPDPEQMECDYRVGSALAEITEELCRAQENFPPMHSAHEGFAVLKEEMDELWECVRDKQGSRDVAAMRKEAVQVAAMAIRFVADICHDEKGQN